LEVFCAMPLKPTLSDGSRESKLSDCATIFRLD
jgi:hypothetical protein